MKKTYNLMLVVCTNILLFALAIVALTSCADNDYSVFNKGYDKLTLTSDQQTTILDEHTHANEAVLLSWTTGNNGGTGNRIYYQLELAPKGTNFQNAYVAVDNETQIYTWSATQENLNSIILDKFDGTPGESIELEARVSAISEGTEKQTSTIDFTVTPYNPVTESLFLIGDATPNGWSIDNATEMTRQDNGKFTWEGNLVEGDYKFVTNKSDFLPSYNNDGEGNLVYRSSDEEPDEKFHIDEAHYYRINVDLLE